MIFFNKGDQFKERFHVSDSVYTQFTATFNDRHPLHTDSDYARSKGFKEKIMQGNILNGFLSHFVGECLPTKDIILHAQEISFNSPLFLNDHLVLDVTVHDVFDSVNVVELKFQFVNSDSLVVSKGRIRIRILP